MPLKLSARIQVGLPIANFANYAKLAREFSFEQKRRQFARRARAGRGGGRDHAVELSAAPDHAQGRARARRRLHGGAQASEVAPLNAFVLAEVIETAGLPKGVFNLVTGTGPERAKRSSSTQAWT